MKVRDAFNNPSGVANMPVKEDRKVAAGKSPDFRNQLERAEGMSYEQQLEELVEEIIRQGEKLGMG